MTEYPTDDETELWIALNAAQRKIYRGVDSALKTEGLPPLRWYDVLWALEQRKNGAGLRAFEMEKSMLFEQSNLSRLLNRMIDEGLVKESVCADDRRAKMLRITAKGRRVRRQMWKVYGPLIHRSMREVSDTNEQKRVALALNSLLG